MRWGVTVALVLVLGVAAVVGLQHTRWGWRIDIVLDKASGGLDEVERGKDVEQHAAREDKGLAVLGGQAARQRMCERAGGGR